MKRIWTNVNFESIARSELMFDESEEEAENIFSLHFIWKVT